MIKNLLSNKKDAKIHKDIEEWLLSDDRMSGGQEGFLEGRKYAFTLAEVRRMFPLQGRGLGRGGDKKPSESINSPSLKFVSSLVLDLLLGCRRKTSCVFCYRKTTPLSADNPLHARIASFTSHSALSTRYSRYPDFTSFHPSANPPFANKFFSQLCTQSRKAHTSPARTSVPRRDSCATHTDKAISPHCPIALSPSKNKKLDCFAYARNDVKNSIVKALSPNSPIALSPLNNKKLDCFAHARNDKSCATHTDKAISPYRPIAISPSNKKAAFTKPSRATSGSESRQIINENHAFRFDLERWRLLRGAVDSRKRVAFTLAEVMIVVAIIGVVAALVLPSFMQDMAERINSNRQANIAQKITKSVELMAVNGDYQDIRTTEQFVNKLSKYLKISKVCDNEHLTDCWPTRKIKTAKGDDYNIENAKTSKDLHTRGSETDNVGVILADGATLIMTFNPDAPDLSAEGGFIPYKKSLPVGGGKFEEFAYSSNATNAIDFVVDVNGKTGPNAENDLNGNYFDIRSFKSASFSQVACAGGFKIDKKTCIVDLGKSYDDLDCTNSKYEEYCSPNANLFIDYWAGANKTCKDMGMRLPTKRELITIRSAETSGRLSANTAYYFHTDLSSSHNDMAGSSGGTLYRAQLNYALCINDYQE